MDIMPLNRNKSPIFLVQKELDKEKKKQINHEIILMVPLRWRACINQFSTLSFSKNNFKI